MSVQQRGYVDDFEDNCKLLLDLIEQNSSIIDLIVEDVESMFVNNTRPLSDAEFDNINDNLLEQNVDKVYTTLKQIVRDWSKQGEPERQCYTVIINELNRLYSSSGLARLAFEIAAMGFKCQGNEFSLHMLIASNFILNKCQERNQFYVYPYVNNWCNNLNFENQKKQISFPDIDIAEFSMQSSQFSMVAGDFLEVYNQSDDWDSIVTCYFIDTAHNVIDYFEKIWKILKPGGYWINFGPLLYHFSSIPNEKSVELNYSQIRQVLKKIGFELLKEETNISSKYLDNKDSMLTYSYDCIYFVAQKPPQRPA